jgi:lipoprotein-releasing system permease protein
MSLVGWIAMRHLRAGRRRFAALITWSSVFGLMLGVMVLTVVVSVMNGFDGELRERLLGSVPHVLLAQRRDGEALPESLIASLRAEAGVRRAFSFFEAAGMVTRGGVVNPVTLFGLEPEAGARFVEPGTASHTDPFAPAVLAPLTADAQGVLLGAPLARHLGLGPGDSVVLVLTEPAGDTVRPKIMRFRLAGTFEIGAELDWSLAIARRDRFTAAERKLLGRDGVRVELADPMRAEFLARGWRERFPQAQVVTWAERYGALFQAVRLEKVLMFLVLLMVVTVAAFSIVSGQLMVVGDKRAEIAILLTMGAEQGLIRRIFLVQGMIIAGLGILLGLGLGCLTAVNIARLLHLIESISSFRLLEDTYFVDLPVDIQAPDLAIITLMSFGLCALAAWLPARRATSLNPVAALHGN